MQKQLWLQKIALSLAKDLPRKLRRQSLLCLARAEALPLSAAQQAKCLSTNTAICQEAWVWLQQSDLHHVIFFGSEDYPEMLAQIPDPPVCLWVYGDKSLLSATQLAVIGTRNPTPHGLALTQQFVHPLAASGVVITSGLALGIDGAAHRATLAVSGHTVAVLGSGLQCVYPKRHQALAQECIQRGGALVSELPLTTPPLRNNFPARNRIISGLAKSVLVVEAGVPSGTLLTAQYALEQGRDVLAIPGSLANPKSRGCHHLIQQGAALVTDYTEVLSVLSMWHAIDLKENVVSNKSSKRSLLDAAGWKLLECVSFEGSTLTQIVRLSQMQVQHVSVLLALFIEQDLVVVSKGLYVRCSNAGEEK